MVLELMETTEKKPITKFDTFTPLEFEELIQNHHQFPGLSIKLDNETVVVDFDEKSLAADALALEYHTLKVNTTRGFHLYFRKPKGVRIPNTSGKTTLIGVKVDYKIGERSHGIIKQDGVMRKIENIDFLRDLSSLPELPVYLYPSKTKDALLDLAEGQGRNDALFKHLLNTLEQYPKTKEKGVLYDLAARINAQVFSEPMEKEELDNLVGSVMNKKLTQDQLYLDPKDLNMTAKYLNNRLKIHRYQARLYFFNEDRRHFDCDDNRLRRAVYNHIELLYNRVTKVLEQFHMIGKAIDDNALYPIQLAGGYILENSEAMELEREFTPLYCPTRYNPDAYCERTDKFLDFLTCNDKDLRMVVEEVMGHVLMTHDFPHKAFFFTGETGGNGKSTFIELLRGMIGDDLVANVPLDKFDDPTMVYSLGGKLVNLSDDIDPSYLEKSGNFKSIVSGDTISVRPIYSQPFELRNTATLIFTCNETPRFKDKTGGLARRMVVIPCENTLKEKDFDMTLKRHLRQDETARSYALNLAIEGARRLKANGGFTKSARSERATKEYLLGNDLVAQFFDHHENIRETFKGMDVKSCYSFFKAWCIDELGEDAERIKQPVFGRAVKKYTGLVSKLVRRSGNPIRVYEDE